MPDDRKYLRQILVRLIVPDYDQRGLSDEQLNDLTKAHKRAFLKHKDRLLVKVSSRGLTQVDERAHKIAEVLKLLKELSVIPEETSGEG